MNLRKEKQSGIFACNLQAILLVILFSFLLISGESMYSLMVLPTVIFFINVLNILTSTFVSRLVISSRGNHMTFSISRLS